MKWLSFRKTPEFENNDTIFEIKTFAGSREQAQDICDTWKEKANSLYPQILKLLISK